LVPPVYPPELLEPEPPLDPDPLVEPAPDPELDPDPDEDEDEDPNPDEEPKPEEEPELVVAPAPEEPPEDPEVDPEPEPEDPLEASSWPEAPTDAFDPQAAPATAAAVNPRTTSPRERSGIWFAVAIAPLFRQRKSRVTARWLTACRRRRIFEHGRNGRTRDTCGRACTATTGSSRRKRARGPTR
jgi:outer membrane biosynthesis protein TonB